MINTDDLNSNRIIGLDDIDYNYINENKFKPSKNKSKLIWIILAIILVLSLVGGTVYYVLLKKKESTGLSKLRQLSDEQLRQSSKIFPDELPDDIDLQKAVKLYKESYLKAARTNFFDILESAKPNNIKSFAAVYLGILSDEEGKFNLAIDFFDRAVQYDSKNFYAYYNRAISLNHAGRNSEAMQSLQIASELRPDLVDADILKGKLLYESGNLTDAEETLEKVTENSDNDLAVYNLGKIYKKQGKINEAKAAFLRAIDLAAAGEVAYMACNELGLIYATLGEGDLPNAKYYFKKATALAPGNSKYHYNLALIEYKMGNTESALLSLHQSIKLGGGNPKTYQYAASLYQELGKFDEAEEALKLGLEEAPNEGELLNALGDILIKQGKWNLAIQTLTKALSVSDKTLEKSVLFYNIGIVYSEVQDWERATDFLKKAYDLDPVNEDIITALGRVYVLNGQSHRAIGAYNEALKINPDSFKVLDELGALYTDLGMYSEAESILVRVIDHHKAEVNDITSAYFKLGQIAKAKRDYDNSINYFKKVIKTPNATFVYDALLEISDTILLSGKPPSLTYIYLQQAIALKPDKYEPRFLLARSLVKENTYDSKEKAEEELAVIIHADHVDTALLSKVHTLRGVLFYKNGLFVKSLDDFRRALELDPSNEEAFQNKRVVSGKIDSNY